MSESPKTKSDVVGVGCDDLLAQKRSQLKAARRESKKAAAQGRHNWGDSSRNRHIKELEREIQILRANDLAHPLGNTMRIRAIEAAADEHRRCGLGRSAALLPVLADGCRLGFGSDLAAETAQLLCCFVLHGGVDGGKLTSAGSDGAAFVGLPKRVFGGLINGPKSRLFSPLNAKGHAPLTDSERGQQGKGGNHE